MIGMKYKVLEEKDLKLMADVLKDDNMIFNYNYLKEFINNINSYGFIAQENETIIGFAYGYKLLRPDHKVMFYLHSIGILSNYQNKGYGTKLMQYINNYVKNLGCSEMFVLTDKNNKQACYIYEKLGGKNDYDNEICYVYDYEGDK